MPRSHLPRPGRSEASLRAEPARLRHTGAGVDVAGSIVAGLDPTEDFMIAVRLMTREVAWELVESCGEDTIGTHVARPLHLMAAGFRLAARSVDGLVYRHRDDFGAERDQRDDDAGEWLRRIRVAGVHSAAMHPYLGS